MSPAPDERERIRVAMDRILGGTPQQSNGALTIVALVLEAGILRNALTQRHTDLKAEFYDKARARGGTPDSERRLLQHVRRLKELRAADPEEIAQLKADIEALVGPCTRPRQRTAICASNSPTAMRRARAVGAGAARQVAGQLAQAHPAAAFASAEVWDGSTACSSGVQQAVVPQQASGAVPALSRVPASALTTYTSHGSLPGPVTHTLSCRA